MLANGVHSFKQAYGVNSFKNNKRKQLLAPGGTERRKHWGMFLLFIEQEIVYKDKEAGRRWKKHYVGVTNPNRREQTTEKYNEERGGDRITKQLHRPDEQQTPPKAFHGVREKTGGAESYFKETTNRPQLPKK